MPISEGEELVPIVFNVAVHTVADKYNISDLAELSASKFAALAKTEWQTDVFAEAIREVWLNAPDRDRELRNPILAVCSDHAKDLFREEFVAAFRAVANSVQAFGGELSSRLACDPRPCPCGLPGSARTHKCSNYRRVSRSSHPLDDGISYVCAPCFRMGVRDDRAFLTRT